MKFQEIEEAGPEKPPYYVLDQWHSIYQRCQPYLQMVDNCKDIIRNSLEGIHLF